MSDVITIRPATGHDDDALSRLAALDSRRPLHGPTVVAERDDRPIAAVALTTGAVVADPFERTTDAIRQLKLRRYLLMRQSSPRGRSWLMLRRFTPAGA